MKNLFFLASLFVLFAANGQNSPYTAVGRGVATSFVTDYQSLGINSSALGWEPEYEGKKITFSTGETYLSFQSDSLNKQKFSNFSDILKTQFNNRTIDSNAIQSILNSTIGYAKAGVDIRANMLWFGGAYKTNKFGGFAFSMNEDYGFSTQLNTNSASVFFQGNWQNLIDSASTVVNGDTSRIAFSSNLNSDTSAGIYSLHLANPLDLNNFTLGSYVRLIWNRNFNFGYGVKLFGNEEKMAVFGGIGLRYIQSMAYYDFNSDNDGLRVNSSLSPSAMNFQGFVSQINPYNAAAVGGIFNKPVGTGYGIDLSASAIFFRKLRVAAAVNNIGSVKYDQFQYKGNTALPQEIAIDKFDPNSSAATIQSILSGNQLLVYQGTESVRVKNAANFRLGANFKPIKQVNVGVDFIAPFDSENPLAYPNGIVAFGAEIRPIRFLALNIGFVNGGAFQGYIPAGINVILGDGAYEFGISSQDIVHFITRNGNSVSAAFGFARFRF